MASYPINRSYPKGMQSRCGIHGDRPAVLYAVFLALAPAEITNNDITLHLQVCDYTIKILFAFLTKASLLLTLEGIEFLICFEEIHDLL